MKLRVAFSLPNGRRGAQTLNTGRTPAGQARKDAAALRSRFPNHDWEVKGTQDSAEVRSGEYFAFYSYKFEG